MNEEIEDNIAYRDAYLMGGQNLICDMVRQFLKTPEAIEFKVTGLNMWIEDGYVNAEWKFGQREKGDIKDE